jgi:hypothetical protein
MPMTASPFAVDTRLYDTALTIQPGTKGRWWLDGTYGTAHPVLWRRIFAPQFSLHHALRTTHHALRTTHYAPPCILHYKKNNRKKQNKKLNDNLHSGFLWFIVGTKMVLRLVFWKDHDYADFKECGWQGSSLR